VRDAGVAATKLAWWRSEVARAFAGGATHPVMQALMPHTATYGIDRRPPAGRDRGLPRWTWSRPATSTSPACCATATWWPASSARWRRASSAAPDPQTLAYAHRLGLALQLTNIIRDVGDDARRGRIYLPMTELQQFDVKAHEILQARPPWGYSDRFTALMRFQAERAHATYDEALALLPEADRLAQKPGLMMANIYRSLLREIEAEGFQVLHQRTSLTPAAQAVDRLMTHWRGR
jgi:phytoene synthase